MKKIFTLILIFMLLASVYGYFRVKSAINAPSLNTSTRLVTIPSGSSQSKVFKILHSSGIWEDEIAFKIRCKLDGYALKAGVYEIAPQTPLPQLLQQITDGKSATRKVTIPEGRASWEIPAYLRKELPQIDSLVWDSLTHNADFTHSLGVQAKDLEGYLLPDTYRFPIDADEKTIIRQMVQANLKLKEKMKALQSEEWKNLGDWHRVLTLASVVEEETGKPEERPLIAGVFLNRLAIGMPLGADPTVRFIYRHLTGPIYKSQLESNNPYNTRKFKGLMPGPISNPGKKAIEATLFPKKTDKLYFVAKDDGSGTHFFSATLSEHNKYKNIAAQNRGE